MKVLLKQPDAADRQRFIDAVTRSRNLHHPWVAPPSDAKAFRAYLNRIKLDNQFGFLVCRKSDNALLGVVNINEVVRGFFMSAYLGYYAFEPHHRQGFMAQGLEQVLRFAFTTLKLHRLEANIQPGNVASIALVNRCGFQKEGYSRRYLKVGGRWKDHERWAVLREFWQKQGGTFNGQHVFDIRAD